MCVGMYEVKRAWISFLRSRLLDSVLDVGIMQMIPPLLAGTRH
jgi:hypothetical protein